MHNDGPSDAQTVSVSDTLPGSFTGATYTVNGGASQPYSSPITFATV